jgi:integrase/recombinase XerC
VAEPTHAVEAAQSTSINDQRRVVEAIASSEVLSEQSLLRVTDLLERFCTFSARAFSIESLGEVHQPVAEAFVRAPSSEGDPSVATMYLRRSVLRLLFRTARELGLADHDPTIDVVLPPRSSLRVRPLSDEEVALCRAASRHSLSATRLPAAWALAEASARSAELGHVRAADVDLDGGRVWLHGSSKVEPRWAPLTDWGVAQVARRLAARADDPGRPVV